MLSCPLPPSLPTPFRAQLPPPVARSLRSTRPVPSGRWAAAHLDAQPAPLRHHAFRQHLGPCHAASRHAMTGPTCVDRSVPDRTRPVHHTHTAAAASRAPRDQSPSAVHAPLPTRERFGLSSTRRGGREQTSRVSRAVARQCCHASRQRVPTLGHSSIGVGPPVPDCFSVRGRSLRKAPRYPNLDLIQNSQRGSRWDHRASVGMRSSFG